MDLMEEQAKNPQMRVTLLYPGEKSIWPKAWIRKNKAFGNVSVYEVVNALDVPIFDGISDPERILRPNISLSQKKFDLFLEAVRPDIIHVHTLMGLSSPMLALAKSKGIKIIYTTHDYYGLCLKTCWIKNDGTLCNEATALDCAQCCQSGPSILTIFLRNQKLVHRFKSQLRQLKSFASRLNRVKKTSQSQEVSAYRISQYKELLSYYHMFFLLVDQFHFNSSVSQKRYLQILPYIQGEIEPVTISDIKDRRQIRLCDPNNISIGYLGGNVVAKGIQVLVEAVTELQKTEHNFTLTLWGSATTTDATSNVIRHGGHFTRDQLENVFSSMDLLIVPSIWPETFGLVVLEALSFGVPVLVSESVGAKDLIRKINPYFIYNNTPFGLQDKLHAILRNPNLLDMFRSQLREIDFPFTMPQHWDKMQTLYNTALSR